MSFLKYRDYLKLPPHPILDALGHDQEPESVSSVLECGSRFPEFKHRRNLVELISSITETLDVVQSRRPSIAAL
jgi:hypothetical protein